MTSQTLELVFTLKLEKKYYILTSVCWVTKVVQGLQEGRGKLRYATVLKNISKAKYSVDTLKNGSCVLQLAPRVFTLSFFLQKVLEPPWVLTYSCILNFKQELLVKVPAVYVSFSLWELVVSWVCFLGIPLFVKKKKYCHCLHAGADLDSLPSYGKRANRIHLNNREYHLK